MMRMTIEKLFLLFLLSGIFAASYSQDDDFGIWYGVTIEHKLIRKLELDLTGNVRTFKNASKINEAFLEAELAYKFNKYLSVGASYRFTEFYEDDEAFHPRHKWFVDIKVDMPLGDLSVSARFRFQERYKTYFEDEEDKIPDSHGRYRLKALYNIPSFPVNPYVAAEIFCPMFTKTTRHIDKDRFMFGVEYNIAKRHSIELEYMFQRDFLPHISDINVISIGYNIKF
jgi:hypothetical protein